jgi:hypothetical protein
VGATWRSSTRRSSNLRPRLSPGDLSRQAHSRVGAAHGFPQRRFACPAPRRRRLGSADAPGRSVAIARGYRTPAAEVLLLVQLDSERRFERVATDRRLRCEACRGARPLVVQTMCATGSEPGARIVYLSESDGRPVRGSAYGTVLGGRRAVRLVPRPARLAWWSATAARPSPARGPPPGSRGPPWPGTRRRAPQSRS